MLSMIWQRYFIRKFLKTFCLFLFCFYGLYILIDYASHTGPMVNYHFQVNGTDVVAYYFNVFSIRAEFILPLALLVAFVYTSTTLNQHQELVAMMASGVGLKKLMSPFIYFALICMSLLYLNEEYLLPSALKKIRKIQNFSKLQQRKKSINISVKNIHLEDGSLILYQLYDDTLSQFFDVFWIPSVDKIYRMKYLAPSLEIPKGWNVDLFEREESGELLFKKNFSTLEFPDIHFNQEVLQSTLLDPEILPLSTLIHESLGVKAPYDEKDSKILTALYWKLGIPFLCLLAIFGPIVSCLRFNRQLPLFFIYVFSLFGLIACYMFLDAAQVVALKQIAPPFWTICGPLGLMIGIAILRYAKV